jgi:hypothetical protein
MNDSFSYQGAVVTGGTIVYFVALEIPQISPKAIPYFTFGPENRHSRAACKLAQWQAVVRPVTSPTYVHVKHIKLHPMRRLK